MWEKRIKSCIEEKGGGGQVYRLCSPRDTRGPHSHRDGLQIIGSFFGGGGGGCSLLPTFSRGSRHNGQQIRLFCSGTNAGRFYTAHRHATLQANTALGFPPIHHYKNHISHSDVKKIHIFWTVSETVSILHAIRFSSIYFLIFYVYLFIIPLALQRLEMVLILKATFSIFDDSLNSAVINSI